MSHYIAFYSLKKLAMMVLLAVLAFGSSLAFARVPYEVMEKLYKVPAIPDGETSLMYVSRQGDQGTYWVWRWQNVYNDFITYCGGSQCVASANSSKTESIATQRGFGVSAGPDFAAFAGELSANWSTTRETSKTFGFRWDITLKDGQNAYGGVIALDKYLPAATLRGAWVQSGYRNYCPRSGCYPIYKYIWNPTTHVGYWKGHVLTQHRTFVCATKTVTTPRVGDGLPLGCSAPQIPY